MTRAVRLGATALAALVVAYAVLCVWAADRFTRVTRTAVDATAAAVGPLHEDVALRTSDGLVLRGWWFPARNGRAVVVVHGKDANRADGGLLAIARALHQEGYGIVAFDLRGHGESEGERFSLGHHERHDVAAAVEHARSRGIAADRIAVFGVSMGAATVLQALRVTDVAAVVADSAYANGPAIVDEAGPAATGLPPIFTPGITLVARTLLGLDADAVDPDRVVASSPTPVLFIHCERDRLIGAHHARELHAARAGNRLWVVPGCGHAGAFTAARAEYLARLRDFLSSHLR